MNQAFEVDLENRRKDLERSDLLRVELEKEIKKLKKKSNGSAQGGWGTFSVVFEDNVKKLHNILHHSSTYISTRESAGLSRKLTAGGSN